MCISVKAAPDAPVFSHNGGFYESTIEVSLSGEGNIYYTLDGSVPTTASTLYTKPVTIEPSSTTPPKGVNIRAAVIGDTTSYVSSNTYFVGEGITDYVGKYPFVNLIADPYDYWDENEGIYTNYSYEHKVPAVFHYITEDGQSEINRLVEIKVSGNGSRSYAKKSLRVYFKKIDPLQSKYLEYNLIPTANIDYYSKVTFRISDWDKTNIKDPVAQQIAKSLNLDVAESVPMVLFLNGEYWGLYECREQHDEDYLAAHYGLDKDCFVYFDRGSTQPVITTQYNGVTFKDKTEYAAGPEDGNEDGLKGESYYREQWDRVKYLVQNCDIASESIYNEFCSLVDVDNFINYTIVYLFAGNDDWPANNFRFWRVTEEAIDPSVKVADGKWRFFVHDFDLAFSDAQHNTLKMCSTQNSSSSPTRHAEFATVFYQNLLKNESFRSELIQRISVYFSTVLNSNQIAEIQNRLVKERVDGKTADLARWKLASLNQWKTNSTIFTQYASGRPNILTKQFTQLLNENYNAGITGTANALITTNTACNINGAQVTNNSSVQLFTGAVATVRAPGAYITVNNNGTSHTAFGEFTFVPEGDVYINANKTFAHIISASVSNGLLNTDVYIDKTMADKLKLFAAGYDDNENITFIKNIDVNNLQIEVPSAKTYKVFVWQCMMPACKSYVIQ